MIAGLEVVRNFTGTSESAATGVADLLEKVNSPDTLKRFKDAGINIRKELAAARDAGEDIFETITRLTRRATGGDLNRLSDFFGEKDSRAAVRALIMAWEDYERLRDDVLNKSGGTVDRNLKRVLDDTQASIDRMANSWGRLKQEFGETIAPGAVPVLDTLSDQLDDLQRYTDFQEAMRRGLEKEGYSRLEAMAWSIENQFNVAERVRMAMSGGFQPNDSEPGLMRRAEDSQAVDEAQAARTLAARKARSAAGLKEYEGVDPTGFHAYRARQAEMSREAIALPEIEVPAGAERPRELLPPVRPADVPYYPVPLPPERGSIDLVASGADEALAGFTAAVQAATARIGGVPLPPTRPDGLPRHAVPLPPELTATGPMSPRMDFDRLTREAEDAHQSIEDSLGGDLSPAITRSLGGAQDALRSEGDALVAEAQRIYARIKGELSRPIAMSVRMSGPSGGGQLVTGNKGRSMANAGTPASGAEGARR